MITVCVCTLIHCHISHPTLFLFCRDLLKWNDCAGEGIIDLGKFYRSAYRNNSAIKLFEKKNMKGGKKDRNAMKQKSSRGVGLVDDGEDIAPSEGDDEAEREAYESKYSLLWLSWELKLAYVR
ncbi:hypothetical protein EON65_10375 [archaeon]|nr:MAG: hypothetical protein EON65_10375 [archaeon]